MGASRDAKEVLVLTTFFYTYITQCPKVRNLAVLANMGFNILTRYPVSIP